jgi:hypothetical protein
LHFKGENMKRLMISSVVALACATAFAAGNDNGPTQIHNNNHSSANQHQGQAQGQAQQQGQMSYNRNQNSNENRNTNANTAFGGQGGRGGTGIGVGVGYSEGSAASSDNAVTNTVTHNYERAASSAFAAPLTSSNDTCMGSSSVGGSGVTFGFSFGTTWTDENCIMLKNAQLLHNLGHHAAAMARLCMDDKNKTALEATGNKCPVKKDAPQAP